MSEFQGRDDAELVALVKSGRHEAFEELYSRYLRRIYNLVMRMVGREDAEEVTQEAFLQAYRTLGKFRGEAQFYTWLYRVASNTALQWIRRRGRREGRQSSFEDLQENAPGVIQEAIVSQFGDPARAAEDSELQRHVLEVLEGLPPNQKLVMLLGPVRGLSYEDMARTLETTVPVVKARLHRARENLRNRVAARYQGGGPDPDGMGVPDGPGGSQKKAARAGEARGQGGAARGRDPPGQGSAGADPGSTASGSAPPPG